MIEVAAELLGPLLVGLFGFVVGRRERNLTGPMLYRCECRHSLSHHRDKKGDSRCMKGNCMCQQYVGSRPVEITG